jgi:hypothetical protein
MKVKCIDSSGHFGLVNTYLTVGQVYEVKEQLGTDARGDYVLVGVPMTWRPSRFVVVSEEPTLTIRQEKPCQVCNRNNDIGVATCWNCGNKP